MSSILKSRTFLTFFVLGIITCLAYWLTDGLPLTFLLIGPPLYVASKIHSLLHSLIPPSIISMLPISSSLLNAFLLFPITLLYYSLIGLHQRYLHKERSWLRRLIVFVTLVFLVGIHFIAWNSLSTYYIPHR